MTGWRDIASAPRDGTRILLLGRPSKKIDELGREMADEWSTPAIEVGWWNPEGDSWVDKNGTFEGEPDHLAVTGTWWAGGGWFQPNEVTHWMPLPEPPLPPTNGANNEG